MVTITNFKKVILSDSDKEFFTLELQGDLELIKSSQTGNIYATAKKTTITSTFNEEMCRKLVGKTLPGKIVKIACDAYDYTIKETGEIVSLEHTYKYLAETANVEEAIFEEELA